MPQFPSVIELSGLNGHNGFTLRGVTSGDNTGFDVASAGDINGDGFDDLMVSAPWAAPHGAASAGVTYVVFGKARGTHANTEADLDPATLDGSNGFVLRGAGAGDQSGIAVAGAGDVNGDGFADMIVGASQFGSNGPGAAYVVFGTGAGFAAQIDLSALDGSDGFRISGTGTGAAAGRYVASAGDVNGDGFADVIVGAPFYSPGGVQFVGAAYVVFGKASGFDADIAVGDLDGGNGFALQGVGLLNYAGSVTSAGDVNGDGFDDMLIGASRADGLDDRPGVTYLLFGKSSGFAASMSLGAIDGSNGFWFEGIDTLDFSGQSVASAGDINGDGHVDLIIGAPFADAENGNLTAGEAYVVLGGLANLQALDAADGTADGRIGLARVQGNRGFTISSDEASDQAGVSVSSAGDVNGDGFDDIILGVIGDDVNGSSSGAAFVLFGKKGGFGDIDIDDIGGSNGFRLNGVSEFDRAANAVASAGDINDDGFGDLIVGTNNTTLDPGEAYVVFGRAPDEAVRRTGTDASQTLAGGAFDDVLSGEGGDDTLHGNDGDDRLLGNDGDDVLIGGKGQDMLFGGAGDDVFTFRATNESFGPTADRIKDFEAGDRIDFSGVANKTGVAFSFIGEDEFSGTAGEVRQYTAGLNTVVVTDVDGDSTADFRVVMIGTHTLTAADFVF